jgi:RNA polymerase sigma-70 factor (ECF subfamily)
MFGVGRKGATPGQLEELYRARFDRFVAVAAGVCGDRDLGRDAVQTAFVTAVRQRRSFRADGPLEAWVWRIVVNEAKRLAREPRELDMQVADEPMTNGHHRDDDPNGVRAWVAALPERQRDAIFLRYYADLEYRQIALVLGVEVGTVSATLAAAHEALRERLEEVQL